MYIHRTWDLRLPLSTFYQITGEMIDSDVCNLWHSPASVSPTKSFGYTLHRSKVICQPISSHQWSAILTSYVHTKQQTLSRKMYNTTSDWSYFPAVKGDMLLSNPLATIHVCQGWQVTGTLPSIGHNLQRSRVTSYRYIAILGHNLQRSRVTS